MITTAIIGTGNMGSALYKGLSSRGGSDSLLVCDEHEEKLTIAPADRRFTDPVKAGEHAECILLAVKPQSFPSLAQTVNGAWSDKLIISIMAGITVGNIVEALHVPAVVRAMPNLGARVQRCVTGWITSSAVSEAQVKHAGELFSAVGTSVQLKEESQIDAFTAIAGSGPAYFFHLAELLEEAAKNLGIDAQKSAEIVRGVLSASALLLDSGEMSAAGWREAVTSKGGVTEAVLGELKNHDFQQVFGQALDAGAARSRSLSQS